MIAKKIMQWVKKQGSLGVKENLLEIRFRVGGFGISNESKLTFFSDGTARRQIIRREDDCSKSIKSFIFYDEAQTKTLYGTFLALETEEWPSTFEEKKYETLDGTQWGLIIKQPDGTTRTHEGSNAYPDNWKDVTALFGIS